MPLDYRKTLDLIQFVIGKPGPTARDDLYQELILNNLSEVQFCAGVIQHGPAMNFTSDQRFDFFSKIPNILYRHEPALANKLTPAQRKQLGWD